MAETLLEEEQSRHLVTAKIRWLIESALEAFQKSLRNHKAHESPREKFVAQWSIGKVLRALGKTEETLSIQQVLLAELGIGGERDSRLYEELAECLLAHEA